MTDVLHIDFETYSERKLGRHKQAVGTCRYAEDPSTELLCMGWAINHEEPEVWVPGDDAPKRAFEAIQDGALVAAWNVEMEIPHWDIHAVGKLGWPEIPFNQWRDTAALALSLALPASLDECASALGLPSDLQKDQRGKYLIQKLCQPRPRVSKANPEPRWTPITAPEDFADFYEYCRQDVVAERAVADALPIDDLPEMELDIWRSTTLMNLRGWTVDLETARHMIALLEVHKANLLSELNAVTQGEIRTAGQLDKTIAWLARHGVPVDNLQAETVKDTLKKKLPRRARRVLQIRQELAKASVNKYSAMIRRASDDGRVRNNILYHGASTGRDAGRGLQIQNFVRKSLSKDQAAIERACDALRVLQGPEWTQSIELLYGDIQTFASNMTRPMLIAADGMVLNAADFSSIENRLTVWIAECEYGIDIFRRGLDEYKVFATRHYGVSYEDVTDAQRQHCKHAVLLCCFGGGAKAHNAQAERFGAPCSMETSIETVESYRSTYAEVKACWYGLEDAAKRAIQRGRPTRYLKIRFHVDEEFLYMTLPSGRRLAYYKPRVMMKEAPWGEMKPTITHMGYQRLASGQRGKWARVKLIPGRIMENAVQASARDAMMAGAKNTQAGGYALVGRVHDELISEAPKGFGSLEDYCHRMTVNDATQTWLTGIPIEAEGWVGKRFRK